MDFKEIQENIQDYQTVTVTKMKHIVEVQYLEKVNKFATIQKLNKNQYMCLCGANKGEIKDFNHIENRSQSKNSLRQTFKKLRYLINNNFVGGDNELFITLTYAENMTDKNRLYLDFNKFIKRLKFHYNKEGVTFDYINIIEPQGRGAWHCHVLMKFNKKMYIDNAFLREKWGQGFVNIHRIKNVDNVGAYLTAYLADVELNDDMNLTFEEMHKMCIGTEVVEKEVEQENGEKIKKKFIKGGRLCLYPPGINIYRKSSGIIMPPREEMLYSDCKKNVVGSAKPHYKKGLEMLDDEEEHFNTIIYEHYNLKR